MQVGEWGTFREDKPDVYVREPTVFAFVKKGNNMSLKAWSLEFGVWGWLGWMLLSRELQAG